MMVESSPWLTGPAASAYVAGDRNDHGRRRFSPRFLAKQVRIGRLRAARVGGRGELLYRKEWLDEWLEELARPVVVTTARRRA